MLALTFAATVHISVLGAFHPVQFELRPALGATLMVETEGRTAVLKDGSTIRLTGPAMVTGRFGSPAHFFLVIPGKGSSKVEREYFGRLEVRRMGAHQLQAIMEMDIETAVASIVEAEGTKGLPFEARRAQAVATRSYLLAAAGKRHQGYDFCDQDHCQYLKDVPAETTPAAKATASTRNQVLVYKGNVVAALYSANCGGHTRDLHEAGWQDGTTPAGQYPYYGVSCPLGGTVSGHRVGMCQLGAIQIARQGKTANVILAHYFPNTQIGMIGVGLSGTALAKTSPAVSPSFNIQTGLNPGLRASAGLSTISGKDVPAAR